jgi:hypothetical protein
MWRSAFLIGGILLACPPLFAGQGPVTGFFALLDEAPLVVTATVADRIDDAAPGMVVYELAVLQVLKGTPPAKNPLVVQDLVFPSDRPALTGGEVWLVALDPLPTSSRYRTLPADKIYLHIRDVRLAVRSAQATAAVQPYLAASARPPAQRRRERIGALIAAVPSPLVGEDALAALAADPSLARAFSEDESRRLASALGNRALPTERRRAILDLVREKRMAPLLPAVRPLLAEPSLAPFARRVLAAFGEPPSVNELRADVQDSDASTRRAALEAAQALPASDRLVFFTGVAADGRDYEVRFAAIDALARDRDTSVPTLTELLHDPDRRISAKAAMALAATGGPDALAALSGTFDSGNYDAQVAAVFALREIGSNDAMRILRQIRAAAPDPRLERVIDLALGVNTHGH